MEPAYQKQHEHYYDGVGITTKPGHEKGLADANVSITGQPGYEFDRPPVLLLALLADSQDMKRTWLLVPMSMMMMRIMTMMMMMSSVSSVIRNTELVEQSLELACLANTDHVTLRKKNQPASVRPVALTMDSFGVTSMKQLSGLTYRLSWKIGS